MMSMPSNVSTNSSYVVSQKKLMVGLPVPCSGVYIPESWLMMKAMDLSMTPQTPEKKQMDQVNN